MLVLSIGTFLDKILYAFDTIFSFIGSLLSDVLFMVESVGNAISNIPNYLAFLPSAVLTLFMSGVTVIVVYKILGRD